MKMRWKNYERQETKEGLGVLLSCLQEMQQNENAKLQRVADIDRIPAKIALKCHRTTNISGLWVIIYPIVISIILRVYYNSNYCLDNELLWERIGGSI